MDLDELDRLISQREGRLEQNKKDGRVPFEKEIVKRDPEMELRKAGQKLVDRARELEILAFDGVTEAMEVESRQIQHGIEKINDDLTQLIAEKQNAENDKE